jgi:hypothetical protein
MTIAPSVMRLSSSFLIFIYQNFLVILISRHAKIQFINYFRKRERHESFDSAVYFINRA